MKPSIVILAGGKGERLGGITKDIPKPMVDVHGKPFLYWLIKHYRKQGFTRFVINTGHLAETIETYSWPRDWSLKFCRDSGSIGPEFFYENWKTLGHWVVNGDTFIDTPLPDCTTNTIVSFQDTDAGAQFVKPGKIKLFPCTGFWDIGTPFGLGTFREYFKAHPLYLEELGQR